MIDGIDRLNRKMTRLINTVGTENTERAVSNAVKIVQAEAKLLCPVSSGGLKDGIKTSRETVDDKVIGTCYVDTKHATFVEFGTGPKGQENHTGISPLVNPAYSQLPWWIHESQVDKEEAEKYHWFYIDTKDGRFYQCFGQAAQPFMYPALKNNEDRVTRNIGNYVRRKVKEAVKGD